MARSERRQALDAASMEAARLHARLGTDFSAAIDVFRVVQELRLWLVTQPLGNLFGFYLRNAEAAGIVLNSGHPETLQRYTCAHELGHHILGHSSSLDLDEDVQAAGGSRTEEMAAQVFAGAFLMPLGLVNRVVRRLGLQGGPLSAADVYQISRDMEVSFTATTWRLLALDRLGEATARSYVKAGAAAAKAALRGGNPAGSARGDLYLLDNPVDDLAFGCRVGDEIRFRLSEDRSTGHVWTLGLGNVRRSQTAALRWDGGSSIESTTAPAEPSDLVGDPVLELVLDDAHAAEGQPLQPTLLDDPVEEIGSERTRQVALVARREGEREVNLELRRPWLVDEIPAASAELSVTVRPEHQLDGHSPVQVERHAARLAETSS